MRRLHAQVTVLAICGATLLDDGPFLVAAAVATTTALVVCGVSRLMAAASSVGRVTSARVVAGDTSRPQPEQPMPSAACVRPMVSGADLERIPHRGNLSAVIPDERSEDPGPVLLARSETSSGSGLGYAAPE